MLYRLAVLFMLLISAHAEAQETGFYLHWNVDHTQRAVRPAYPLTETEAKVLDSYYVAFDDQGRLVSAKFYQNGKTSPYGQFGAAELVRRYKADRTIEEYRDLTGTPVANYAGIHTKHYLQGTEDFFHTIKHLDSDGMPVADRGGVAEYRVKRDEKNRVIMETRHDLEGNIIPEHNGFERTYFGYDAADFATYRQSRSEDGELMNGSKAYAMVAFKFDQRGNFLSEDVYDEKGEHTTFPNGTFSRIEFRDFNKYGKPARIYYFGPNGYASTDRAVAKISYTEEMRRKELSFFDNEGNPAEAGGGTHKVIYKYGANSQFQGIDRYNLKGELLTR